MDEKTTTELAPKKAWTKGRAITVMTVGGLMLLLAIVIPSERPSTVFTIRLIVGLVGFVMLLVGSARRPMKAPKDLKE